MAITGIIMENVLRISLPLVKYRNRWVSLAPNLILWRGIKAHIPGEGHFIKSSEGMG